MLLEVNAIGQRCSREEPASFDDESHEPHDAESGHDQLVHDATGATEPASSMKTSNKMKNHPATSQTLAGINGSRFTALSKSQYLTTMEHQVPEHVWG